MRDKTSTLFTLRVTPAVQALLEEASKHHGGLPIRFLPEAPSVTPLMGDGFHGHTAPCEYLGESFRLAFRACSRPATFVAPANECDNRIGMHGGKKSDAVRAALRSYVEYLRSGNDNTATLPPGDHHAVAITGGTTSKSRKERSR